jgi:hypothetical protein
VRNSGTITATLGTVSLAAGNAFTLDFYGDHLITLAVNDQIAGAVKDVQTGQTLKSLVSNSGKLSSNGGRVELTAAAARAVVDSVINNTGVIEANSIGTKNGMIVLSAATGASKGAGAPTQVVKLSGQISAAGKNKGTKGGTVVVTGESIQLAGATIDASGDAGGGHVLIGGDTGGGNPSTAAANIELAKLESFGIPTATTVSVDAGTVINASATGSGNGGKVVLWSDQQTTFAGTILAQGGAGGGNGGFVETSSHGVLSFTGTLDLAALAGTTGTALLDPYNVEICICDPENGSFSGGNPVTWVPTGTSIIDRGELVRQLGSANVIVTTSGAGTDAGNISVGTSLTWTSSNTLTLNATNNINISFAITAANGGLTLNAGNAINPTAAVNVATFTLQSGNWSQVSSVLPAFSATDFRLQGGTFLRALGGDGSSGSPYQITDVYGLQGMASTSLTNQNCLLANNIDASGTANWNGGAGLVPIGNISFGGFTGSLDGQSHTINGLTIAPTDASINNVGLFGTIYGSVSNLTLANARITANPNVELPSQFVGILAGQSAGTFTNVSVAGSINGSPEGVPSGVIAGGMVGQILQGGKIDKSSANVTVTVGDAADESHINYAGGLAGINMGAITNSSATGNVSGGTLSSVGGLVGQNGLNCDCELSGPGTIVSSSATGTVSGSGNAKIGGFVGGNDTGSTIQNSYATGNVTGTSLVSDSGTASVAGFAGQNNGTITNSYSNGNVSVAGSVFGDFVAGGFVGDNNGTIQGLGRFTYATGSVTGSANSVAGGFAGENQGNITFAYASGNVHVGSDSYAGGFFAANIGTIFQAFATGSVTDDGNTVLGGFGAANLGSLSQVFATGAVTGGTNTVVGGLVAVNAALVSDPKFNNPNPPYNPPVGSIVDAYATGAASGGAGSIVGGLVAVNDGVIKTSYSAGPVTGGTTGGLVAQNNPSFQFANLNIPSIVDDGGKPVPLQPGAGAITNSYWNTQTSGQSSSAGGTGMTSQQLAAGLPPGFDPNVWTILPDPSFPYFPWSPIFPSITLAPNTPNTPPNAPSQQQIIDNLTGDLTLVSLPPGVIVLPYPPPPPAPGPQVVGEPRLFAVPPAGETRYVKDEVLLMVDCAAPQSAIDAVARDMGLTIVASQCLTQTGKNLLRMHINGGQTLAQVIRALARYQVVALAQANFIYHTMQDKVAQEHLAQDLAQDPDLAGRTQEGDSAQYAVGKLGLIDIHRLIKGTNISIAVIDSQIDMHHPDMDGVFADQYDAVGGPAEKPHPHGTGMAGAIAAHRKLMGIAPAARIYAIHAFSSNAASADSTTFNILKGLDWAASKGVRVINMSFAGPRDPSMERALKNAHDKGIVLIAAAGNAGPKSPPLFPGADPNVIAVTATDSNDKIFSGANRGRYIAVAAPGVDILVPAPDDTYQLTTGTSVSSAEVSGIVALLLERNPNLGPEDIRKILTTSAKHPGTKDRDDDFGSGLVDPSKAIQDAGELKPVGQPAKR